MNESGAHPKYPEPGWPLSPCDCSLTTGLGIAHEAGQHWSSWRGASVEEKERLLATTQGAQPS